MSMALTGLNEGHARRRGEGGCDRRRHPGIRAASMKATPEDVAKVRERPSTSTPAAHRLNEGHARRRGEAKSVRKWLRSVMAPQ